MQLETSPAAWGFFFHTVVLDKPRCLVLHINPGCPLLTTAPDADIYTTDLVLIYRELLRG